MVPESGSPSPDDVDQGSAPETPLPYEVDPVLTDPDGDAPQGDPEPHPGGGSDESAPVEAEPPDDLEGGLQLTDPGVPDGADTGALPVAPTAPTPSDIPAAPEDPGATPGAEPRTANPANRAAWRAADRKPRGPRARLSGKPRPPVQAPAVASDPVATQTSAVAGEPVAVAAAPLGPGRFHVVRPGDSLWSIASRLLGPGASDASVALEVRRLWRLNATRIGTGDPNLLRVGVKLRLR